MYASKVNCTFLLVCLLIDSLTFCCVGRSPFMNLWLSSIMLLSVCLFFGLSGEEEIQFFNYMCSLWRSMEVRLAAALSVGFGTFLSDLGSIVNKYVVVVVVTQEDILISLKRLCRRKQRTLSLHILSIYVVYYKWMAIIRMSPVHVWTTGEVGARMTPLKDALSLPVYYT